MRILGINTSHNPSICQVTDGKVDWYIEEDRVRREKYWAPSVEDTFYHSIKKHLKIHPDYIIVASYDRDFYNIEIPFKEDIKICDKISSDLNQQVHFYKTQHHIYHAYTAFHLSKFDEAIVVVMDGGGGQEFPMYQEIESIYLMNKNEWQRKYLHASIIRMVEQFKLIKPPTKEFIMNDCDIVLSAEKSMGYKFADMAVEYMLKHGGEEAGKIMGMASYPEFERPYKLQKESTEYTIKLLKRAIKYSDCKNIILSGGYALNCVTNYECVKAFPKHNFFVDPIAHDGGTAMGAALWMYDTNK